MIVDLRYAAVIGTFHVGFNPQGVAVSPDGARVYVTNISNDNVAVIDTATNTVLRTIRVGDFPQDVAISHDGSLANVTAMTGTAVSVIDTATDTIIATLPVSGSTGVAIRPDGNTIYVASVGKVTVLKFGQAQTPAASV